MQRIREQKYRKCTQDAYSCQVSFSVSETGQAGTVKIQSCKKERKEEYDARNGEKIIRINQTDQQSQCQ